MGARRKAGATVGGAFCTLPGGGAALGAAGTTLGTVGGLPGGGPPGIGEAADEGAGVAGAAAGGTCWVLPCGVGVVTGAAFGAGAAFGVAVGAGAAPPGWPPCCGPPGGGVPGRPSRCSSRGARRRAALTFAVLPSGAQPLAALLLAQAWAARAQQPAVVEAGVAAWPVSRREAQEAALPAVQPEEEAVVVAPHAGAEAVALRAWAAAGVELPALVGAAAAPRVWRREALRAAQVLPEAVRPSAAASVCRQGLFFLGLRYDDRRALRVRH